MIGIEHVIYAYVAIGAALALVSLLMNWARADRLSPHFFTTAHVLWPVTFFLVLRRALFDP